MGIKEIVEKWLIENKYDGLYQAGECACEVGELFPCDHLDGICSDCTAGYKKDTPNDPNGYDFYIGQKKNKDGE